MDTINDGHQNFFDDLYDNEDGDHHQHAISHDLYNLRCAMHDDEEVNLDEFYQQNQILLDWTHEIGDIHLNTHQSSSYINQIDKNVLPLDDICDPLQNYVDYTDPSPTVDNNILTQNKLDINESSIADMHNDLQDFYLPQSCHEQELSSQSPMNIVYTDTIDSTSITTTYNYIRQDDVMGQSKDKNLLENNTICTHNNINHDDHYLRYDPSTSSTDQCNDLSNSQGKPSPAKKRFKRKSHLPSSSSLHQFKNIDPLLRPSRHNDLTPNPHKLIKAGQDLNKLMSMMDNLAREDTVNPGYQPQIRREKNKIASRICRLKKKQAYESNKIKLYGLEKEHDQITTILASLKKELLNYQMNPTMPINVTWSKILTDIEQTCNPTLKVAGRSSDYVRDIISQIVQVKSENN